MEISMEYFKELFFKMYPDATEEYYNNHIKKNVEFMLNKDNVYNCTECPDNNGCDNCRYPCGQQYCSVTIHAEELKYCIKKVERYLENREENED